MNASSSVPFQKNGVTLTKRITSFLYRICVLLIIISIFRTFQALISSSDKHSAKRIKVSSRYPLRFSNYQAARHSWISLSTAIESARPTFTGFSQFQPTKAISLESIQGEALDYTNVIPIGDNGDINLVKNSQNRFANSISTGKVSVPFSTGKSGIVITADNIRLPSVYLQLLFLQKVNSNLAVEVFLHSYSDYDEHLCDDIFPTLNAECRILEDYLKNAPLPRLPESNRRRQINPMEPLFKYLAVYFSSFQNVLLLDPSTLPINKPDEMFFTDPFLTYGMVLWPDFWASSESTETAKIQDRRPSSSFLPEDIRSIDLGQFLISKDVHGNSLLQAIYYTTYGENIFDPLFKQGEYGDRGADAIKFAAKFHRIPFYVARKYTEAIGYPDEKTATNGETEISRFKGTASIQSYPQDDYHKIEKEAQRPIFLRQNLHPNFIEQSNYIFTESQKHHRMWEWFDAKDRINDIKTDDIERLVWQTLETIACKDKTNFQAWSSQSSQDACTKILQHEKEMGWEKRK